MDNAVYTLELRGLSYHGFHGVFAHERLHGQAFLVDVSLTYQPGDLSDSLEKALDYGKAERVVAAVVEGPPAALLETVADNITAALFKEFPNLLAVEVAIHKPRAPLAGAFRDVVVRRQARRVVRAYLGLGSNLGDRRRNLRESVRLLGAEPGIRVMAVSPLYETAPMHVVDQPAFLNAAVAIDTDLFPGTLLDACKRIEAAIGRVPGTRWGPRIIDIDILLYGPLQLTTGRLQIPHPRLDQRAFALRPLHDLDPEAVFPSGETVAGALARCSDQNIRQVEGPEWALPVGDS